MDDIRIVELYFERDELALSETAKKYGRYCHTIAYNILCSDPDAEECVNDTYLRAWNAIPPHKPNRLSAFLGKITRNLALNRYARDHAQKRGNGTEVALDELAEVLADPNAEAACEDSSFLQDALNRFLEDLPADARIMFVRRYFYLCSIAQIAQGMKTSENRVKVSLHRTREKLKVYLEKEGILL